MACVYLIFFTLIFSLVSTRSDDHFVGELIFGQVAPFSGDQQYVGTQVRAGILAAFKEVNNKGGVHGRQLQLVSLDDHCNPEDVPIKTRQLLDIPNMFALIGFYGADGIMELLPILNEQQITNIAPLTGSSAFRHNFNQYNVHVRTGYDDETLAMVNFLITRKAVMHIGIWYEDDAFGGTAMKELRMDITKTGLDLVHVAA
eukprot:CAMPEP_0174350010 /NCGR_PEP_ID=MMETSP0811_2-20130205/6933_1 /TAXON_ID=73025 ORGANISM="Eutreptiella gymnastica-like, Strain CCMP1594" /NCGR_SAMPLE_ID=MMETSP0811_2 /ASSEMBLY_ACC=CAM_ASM_000667 /LENGTH=200 /DNA_ID=CAMNT_0015477893 /DNA_START=144 /DNA_END=742 /DNA_ORIENTATION=-